MKLSKQLNWCGLMLTSTLNLAISVASRRQIFSSARNKFVFVITGTNRGNVREFKAVEETGSPFVPAA
jgi:hypothetical protein